LRKQETKALCQLEVLLNPFHKVRERLCLPILCDLMRHAARLARRTLDLACSAAEPGVTSDEVDTVVHEAIIAVRERRRDDLIMEKEQ
jgi:hypothetical protein